MDSFARDSQYFFAYENELPLSENACLPDGFFLPSIYSDSAQQSLEISSSTFQSEQMQVETEIAISPWKYTAECHRDRLQTNVPDHKEYPGCKKRCLTINGDGVHAEESEFMLDFEPSSKKHKGEIEYHRPPPFKFLPGRSAIHHASPPMTPDDQDLYGYKPSEGVVVSQMHQRDEHQAIAGTPDLQEETPTTLSSVGREFGYDFLELEAAEASMKIEGAISLLNTGEKASSGQERPQTSSVSVRSSEISAVSPTMSDKGQIDASLSNADALLQQCDTCFGMIHAKFSNSSFVPDKDQPHTEVCLKVNGELIFLYQGASGKFLGIIDGSTGRTLGQLKSRFTVAYQSSITFQDGYEAKQKASPREYKFQIIIYGLVSDADEVGTLLFTHDLCLQHPLRPDPTKLYSNPHYLSWPGREMNVRQYSSTGAAYSCPDESVLDEVGHARVLQIFDSARGPTTFVKPRIATCLKTALKDYQLLALVMMFEKENGVIEGPVFPSLWQVRDFCGKKRHFNVVTKAFEAEGADFRQGGLLADDMGLGKTLTTLAFIASSKAAGNGVEAWSAENSSPQLPSLVVAPKTAIPVWDEQIQKHFESNSLQLYVYHGAARKTSSFASLKHDIVITTYETLTTEWSRHAEKPLFSHTWHRIILDEAHMIRNTNSAKHRAVCDLKAYHRWCLTGTPVQNRIEDYGAIVKFLRISPFVSKHAFNHYIANPIQSGRDEGFRTLETIVGATSLRRTKQSELNQGDLPKRQAIFQPVELSVPERSIYEFFKKRAANVAFAPNGEAGTTTTLGTILPTLTKLRQICNHSTGLSSSAMLPATEFRDIGVLTDGSFQQDRCDHCHLMFAEVEDVGLSELDLSCAHSLCQRCLRLAQENENMGTPDECLVCPICSKNNPRSPRASPGGAATFQKPLEADLEPSTKILALLQNLRQDRSVSSEPPYKSVVFSCWTRMLDIIELILKRDGFKVQRIDGSKSLSQRRNALKSFREDSSCLVMLASIDCAGCGLDLTAANRVHLMEPQWNPMVEEQALDRVYRLGQQREVLAIRYFVKDSIEEYVQQVQKSKTDLISRTFGQTGLSQHRIEQERLDLLKRTLL